MIGILLFLVSPSHKYNKSSFHWDRVKQYLLNQGNLSLDIHNLQQEIMETFSQKLHLLQVSCIGEGNGNPLQCSCLENPRDRGAWWATVYGVAQSRTQLKRLSSSSSSNNLLDAAADGISQLNPISHLKTIRGSMPVLW